MPDEIGDLEPLRVVAPVETVLAGVVDEILRRGLRPGAQVPGEAELTGVLGISRSGARRALAALDSAGFLEPATASRARTLADTRTGEIGRLLRLVLWSGNDFDAAEVLGVRTAVERAAAARAAAAATEDDLADLERLVHRMHDPEVTAEEFLRLDTAFHLRVARASGGALERPLLEGLSDQIEMRMRQAFADIADWSGTARRLAEEHERLLAIIRRRRAAEAADFVETHVHDFYAAS
ncbi:MAG: FadR family transcriptional regulator [Pseudonocardia sp.]|nr:FadR family transcriptional regulator [Pseudonocardia sp.]